VSYFATPIVGQCRRIEHYEIDFLTTHVAADAKATTISQAMLIVTRPEPEERKHVKKPSDISKTDKKLD
jgi:hypothetical protein